MKAAATLIALAGGDRPKDGLLHNCRFEAAGAESYGIEAIVARFGAAPPGPSPDAKVIETPGHVALFDGKWAVFGDVYAGNIARLWVVGADMTGKAEPGLAVPFDPDLDQAGGDVFFASQDHPDLDPTAAPLVMAAGRAMTAAASGPRTRAFAIRAFGTADTGAVLFALFRLRPDQQAAAGFHLMAARWDDNGAHIVSDPGSEAVLIGNPWAPRFA